jgi:4-hydroxythreonine-4-phosphate dehydrogenase
VRRPRIAITLGDPRGIGVEVVRKALRDPTAATAYEPVLIGPSGLDLEADVSVGEWSDGMSSADAGRLSGLAIERAVELALNGDVAGIATAPIDKQALLAGGYDYPGHTEMLGALTGSETHMMLASDRLRIVLATTHIPLREVADRLDVATILRTAAATREGMGRWYGFNDPRVALCALNPHAGDGGRFGSEDEDVLAPAAREAGLLGPFPADTVFVRAMRGEFDVVIAPYHDVGMTAIKVASFGRAVNVTLGLPFPRTSPDHGTAMDIAGRGVADASSMMHALLECARMARRANIAQPVS